MVDPWIPCIENQIMESAQLVKDLSIDQRQGRCCNRSTAQHGCKSHSPAHHETGADIIVTNLFQTINVNPLRTWSFHPSSIQELGTVINGGRTVNKATPFHQIPAQKETSASSSWIARPLLRNTFLKEQTIEMIPESIVLVVGLGTTWLYISRSAYAPLGSKANWMVDTCNNRLC